MDSIADVKGELSALAQTKTLDELKSAGKKRVRVVRAQQIAEMIAEAVQRTVRESGLVSHEEADELVEKSRAEFRDVIQERERQLSEAKDATDSLAEVTQQRDESRKAFIDARKTEQAATETAEQLSQQNDELHEQVTALQGELEAAQQEIEKLGAPGDPAMSGMNMDMMMKLMTEIAELKAGSNAAAPEAASGELGGLIDKLADNMNSRLDQMGKKMGISSAVDADQIDFKAMFDKDDTVLESNMDTVEVKKKTGTGIAANLARLKKLKGGD